MTEERRRCVLDLTKRQILPKEEFPRNEFRFDCEVKSKRALKLNASPIRPEILLGIKKNKELINCQTGRVDHNLVQSLLFRKQQHIDENTSVPKELVGSIVKSLIYNEKQELKPDIKINEIQKLDPVTNIKIVNLRNKILELVDNPISISEIQR